MRKVHDMEINFEEWKKAGYGDKKLNPIQNREITRAFMGGVFSGLNFLIGQLEKDPNQIEAEIANLYEFLKAFHDNEENMGNNSPYGKRFY